MNERKNPFLPIICLVFCCFCLLLPGCGQTDDPRAGLPEPAFAEGEPHLFHPGVFREWFKTMSSTAGPCTVSVRDTIYSEEQAAEWWYAIQSDLAAVHKTLDMEEDAYAPFTVYIVDETPNGIRAGNAYLYCTPEDILSGGYREGLVRAALGVDETWKLTGLTSSIFFEEPQESFLSSLASIFSGEEEETDAERLAAYLESGRNIPFLGLYAPYFCEDFAGELGVSMARIASQLLCEHVIAEHGGAMLVNDACIGCRQELLDELGLEHTYTDVFGDFDSGFTYSSSEDYPLIVTTERGDVFNIVRLPEGEVTTPTEVCWLLYDAWKGPQVILEAVRAEAPEYADILEKNYSKSFICTLDPDRYGSVAWSSSWSQRREIELGQARSIVHEIMHLLIPIDHYITEQWKYEACAEVLWYKYYPRWYQSYYYEVFSSEDVNLETPQLYLVHADFPQTADEVDVMFYIKSLIAANHTYLSEEEYDKKWRSISVAQAYQDVNGAEISAEGGNKLSYSELATFADYLIENYSLSTFLEYCLDGKATFEGAYGMDFEAAEAAWLEDLLSLAP